MNDRIKLNEGQKGYILLNQNNCCFYCGVRFTHDMPEVVKHNADSIPPRWDHVKPWSIVRDTFDDYDIDNYVASCWFCNTLKSDRVYANRDEARREIRKLIRTWFADVIEDEAVPVDVARVMFTLP